MRIFHVIDSLEEIGGAEILLVNSINKLPEHIHTIVVLKGHVKLEINKDLNIQVHQIGFKGYKSLFKSVYRLKKLIQKQKPEIIHAHLPLATFIARLASHRNLKFIFSVHNNYSYSLKKTSPTLFLMEKFFSSSSETAIFVSDAAREDYLSLINFKGSVHVLHNFINDEFFEQPMQNLFYTKK